MDILNSIFMTLKKTTNAIAIYKQLDRLVRDVSLAEPVTKETSANKPKEAVFSCSVITFSNEDGSIINEVTPQDISVGIKHHRYRFQNSEFRRDLSTPLFIIRCASLLRSLVSTGINVTLAMLAILYLLQLYGYLYLPDVAYKTIFECLDDAIRITHLYSPLILIKAIVFSSMHTNKHIKVLTFFSKLLGDKKFSELGGVVVKLTKGGTAFILA